MALEFYDFCASGNCRIHELKRLADVAFVVDADLGDDEGTTIWSNLAAGNVEGRHCMLRICCWI
jgi:hypothetical protein